MGWGIGKIWLLVGGGPGSKLGSPPILLNMVGCVFFLVVFNLFGTVFYFGATGDRPGWVRLLPTPNLGWSLATFNTSYI